MNMTSSLLTVNKTMFINQKPSHLEKQIQKYKKSYDSCIDKITELQEEIVFYESQLHEYFAIIQHLEQMKDH